MSYRVVQWSVGGVGRQALRALVRSSLFELVGLYSHAQERAGRDAGELAGLGIEAGIRPPTDGDALLALRPDCVVYTSVGETRPKQATADLVGILGSGAD